jgi:CheY-like chemotaxis protein
MELLALDKGRGMEDMQRYIRDGYSTAGSTGTGLGAISRQSDCFALRRITAPSQPIIAAAPRSPEEAANRNQTVLVVDDNKEVREVTILMLDSLGYCVLGAADAIEALTIINSVRIDLLVSDVVMPGIDGFELARRARALRPGLPIIVMSGYTAMPSEAPRTSEFPILRKPFLRAEVAGKIRDALRVG